MPSLSNGQCAHRWVGAGRCLELAVTTRPIRRWAETPHEVVYDVPLCAQHADVYDETPAKVRP